MRKRAPAQRSALDNRIQVHDRHQLELKLEYQPRENERDSRYVVEAYVCVPANLNVSSDTMAPSDFYADIHNYVRLKTPELSWTELGALPDSPLVRASELLRGLAAGGDPGAFIYECKLFACVFRSALRELSELAERELAGSVASVAAVAAVAQAADVTLDGARQTLARFRSLAAATTAAGIADRAVAAHRLADEHSSLSVEHMIRRVIVCLGRISSSGDAHTAALALRRRLLETILDEERYRRGRGFSTIIDPRSDNEPYIYRAGLLKKYCSSALFLHIHRHGARKRWQDLLYALAAGIAMSFFLSVAFWAEKNYPGMAGLFVIPVIAYMFREHLKDAVRTSASRFLEKHLFDRKIVIDDPAGGTFGTCREKLSYIASDHLPEAVRALRRLGVEPTARRAEEELAESVIHYKKELVLDGRRLSEQRGGGGLTDILRFHIARLLRDMDEPDQEIEYVDAETDAIGAIRAAKTYHVDVVFRFVSRAGQEPQLSLMRLILDRNGIKRIERIGGLAAEAVPAALDGD